MEIYFEYNRSKQIEIFTGDINIDIMNNYDNDSNNYRAMMNSIGFTSLINATTRCDSRTCIDHIFLRSTLRTNNIRLNSFILDSYMTDHFPVLLQISNKHSIQENHLIKTSNSFDKLCTKSFHKLIKEVNWLNVTQSNNVELATNSIAENITNCIKQRTCSIKNIKHPKKLKPWITTGIATSIKHRDKLKRNLFRNFSIESHRKYNEYRNYIGKLIKNNKKKRLLCSASIEKQK